MATLEDKKRARESFKEIRHDFFPRWDRKRQWIVKIDSRLPGDGRCFDKRKEIVLGVLPDNKDELDRLLIHEICHAVVSNGGHGKTWHTRYAQALEHAFQIGRQRLAQLISEEIDNYKISPIIRAHHVYGLIQGWTLENPDVSYRKIAKAVARDFGLYLYELERQYPRSREIYREARKQAKGFR